jgi:predicted secreted protein
VRLVNFCRILENRKTFTKDGNMKRIVILFLVFFSLAAGVAKAPEESQYTDHNKTLYVSEKSPTLTLKLQGVPSTGFIWILKQSDRNLLKLVKHSYTPNEKNMPGAPGTDTWIFRANLNAFPYGQRTELVFIHAQPWNLHEQISVRKFKVARR